MLISKRAYKRIFLRRQVGEDDHEIVQHLGEILQQLENIFPMCETRKLRSSPCF